jgi:hypothetical protein
MTAPAPLRVLRELPIPAATSASGLGPPLPHLQHDREQPRPHLRHDRAVTAAEPSGGNGRSTGVATKNLMAMQNGVPLVTTSAGAKVPAATRRATRHMARPRGVRGDRRRPQRCKQTNKHDGRPSRRQRAADCRAVCACVWGGYCGGAAAGHEVRGDVGRLQDRRLDRGIPRAVASAALRWLCHVPASPLRGCGLPVRAGLGLPHPHRPRDMAHPMPRRSWVGAHPSHICTGTW